MTPRIIPLFYTTRSRPEYPKSISPRLHPKLYIFYTNSVWSESTMFYYEQRIVIEFLVVAHHYYTVVFRIFAFTAREHTVKISSALRYRYGCATLIFSLLNVIFSTFSFGFCCKISNICRKFCIFNIVFAIFKRSKYRYARCRIGDFFSCGTSFSVKLSISHYHTVRKFKRREIEFYKAVGRRNALIYEHIYDALFFYGDSCAFVEFRLQN